MYFGNYNSEAGLSQPYFRQEITNLFGLPEPRPCHHGEPIGTMPTATARDCQAPVLHQQSPRNMSLLDGVQELIAPRPTVTHQPLEVPREPTMVTRQLPDILSTAAPFYRVLGQSVMKRAEKMGFQKPPLFYGNAAVA